MSSGEDSDLEEAAERALAKLVPAVSKGKYEKAYEKFRQWCCEKKVKTIDESKLMVYFDVELEKFQASTAWSTYSMLKAMLRVKDNIDIGKFNNLRALLKRKGDDYLAKKSRILYIGEMYRFLKEAPDDVYLAAKVIFMIQCKV